MCPQITRLFKFILTFGTMSTSSNGTKDKTTQNILNEDDVEGKMMAHEKELRDTFENTGVYCKRSNTECPRKCGIDCQFKTVTIQNKRKQNLPEGNYNFSSKAKIGRSENKKSNFDRKEENSSTVQTDFQHFEFEERQNLVTRLLTKDKDGDTILHLSIVHNDVRKSKSLIEILSGKLDVVNKLQQTPLHLSVLTCQPAIVEFLIFHGASVNMMDRNGQTALHLASKNADNECVKAIKNATECPAHSSYVVQKPDFTLKNFKGQAAFHLAILSGSREIAKTLLDMKADINIQDGTSGRTALHLAVESHNINMITFLLENNVNVNATTFSGNTALHLASGLGMDQIVQLLIRNGANINITNIEGDAPLYTKIVESVQWKPQSKMCKKSDKTQDFLCTKMFQYRTPNCMATYPCRK
ncbi:NF-kappa-B inhibitor epsilon-like isoform X2 [Dendronephthya gigantea]|nr:NF-kappa-B inhibitor epsilon-like isoform X2 [Dendronephthya gigantea]